MTFEINRVSAPKRKNRPEVLRAASARYLARHPERVKEKSARWRAKNVERVQQYRKEYRQRNLAAEKARSLENALRWAKDNPEKARENKRAWKRRNRHLVCADVVKRQHAAAVACPPWSEEFIVSEIYHLARLRTKFTGVPHEVDHVVPLRHPLVSGLHAHTNLRVVPHAVNRAKNNKHWPEMP